MNPLQPLINYAKKEHLRLLIEIDNSGYTVLYCDKTEKRNFLKQIRLNKIKIRIKIVAYGYDIEFPEEPTITELPYRMGKVMKVFRKERTIFNTKSIYGYVTILVDFPETYRLSFINNIYTYSCVESLNVMLSAYNIKATINRDRNTFIIYYKGVE